MNRSEQWSKEENTRKSQRWSIYLVHPAMLCNDAREKTKRPGFALSATMEKEAFCSFAMDHDRVN